MGVGDHDSHTMDIYVNMYVEYGYLKYFHSNIFFSMDLAILTGVIYNARQKLLPLRNKEHRLKT